MNLFSRTKKNCFIIDLGVNFLENLEGYPYIGHFPLGALSIASYCEKRHMPVEFISYDYYFPSHKIFPSRKDFLLKIKNLLTDKISKHQPVLIGISISYTVQCILAYETCEIIKQINPQIITVTGGPHVTFLDEYTLNECKEIDIVVRGEGEWTFYELFSKYYLKKEISPVAGITFRKENKIYKNDNRSPGNLSDLPPINFNLIPSDFYHKRNVNIMPSRGCAYRCKFCVEQKFWGNQIRTIPIKKLIYEAKYLFEHYSLDYLCYEDSMLNINNPYFIELANELIKIPNKRLSSVLARIDSIDQNALIHLKKAGFNLVWYGIESGSEKVLKAMNKSLNLSKMRETFIQTRKIGLEVGVFWLVGYPGDNKEESQKTLNLMKSLYEEKLINKSKIYRFIPYPGTDFFINPETYKLKILHFNWEEWRRRTSNGVCEQLDFSKEEVTEIYEKMVSLSAEYEMIESFI